MSFGRWNIQGVETLFFLLLLFGLVLSWLSSVLIAPIGGLFAGGLLIVAIIYISRHSIRHTQPLIWLSLLAALAHIAFALYVIPFVNGYYEQRNASDVIIFFKNGQKLTELVLSNPREAITLFFQQAGLSNTAFFWVWGIFYFVTGGSLSAITVLFGWFSVRGGLYFVQAFQPSLSDRQMLWYAVLVLFFPSILLWTTMPLKDTLTFWSLGLVAYGVSLLLSWRLTRAGVTILFGDLTCMAIRPYFLLFVTFSIIAIGILRIVGATRSKSYRRVVADMTIVPVNVFLAIFLVANNFFVGSLDLSYWVWYQNAAGNPTSGSALPAPGFEATEGLSATEWLPTKVNLLLPSYITTRLVYLFTVLFRPLPWEAHNIFALFASLENVGLLILTVNTLFRFRTIIDLMKSNLMWLFIFSFATLFVGVYSFQVLNLGTMARVKVNVLPFLFPFFALVFDNLQVMLISRTHRDHSRLSK